MKPLQRARRSLRTAREGTSRTVRWFGGGIASGPRRLVGALGREGRSGDGTAPGNRAGAGAGIASAAPRAPASQGDADRGPGPVARLRARGRSAVLWAAGGLLVAAWIGWTAYVWAENGASAGIGVLVSWPAVAVALALVTSPLWATWLLRRERRAGDEGDAAGLTAERPDGGSEASADHA